MVVGGYCGFTFRFQFRFHFQCRRRQAHTLQNCCGRKMSRTYDNWERLVASVLKKEQLWELFHAHSRSPSVLSETSDFSSSSYLSDNVSSWNLMLVFFKNHWPVFDFEDMLSAPAKILGKGNFGIVYSVKLDSGVTIVVKRLKFSLSEQDFKRHMEVVGNVRHTNVASLMAYLTSKDEKLMLYDHYCCGSMSELLYGETGKKRSHVDWETRLRIAIGAARGISHIHTQNGGKLVHGNIKASNIFLDSENYGIVSDLGLANMVVTTFTRTAQCYSPEVKNTQNLSQASDVYSFGILLLELVIRESSGGNEAVHIVKWVNSFNHKEWNNKVFDEDLPSNPTIREQMASMLSIGISCVAKSPKKRPKMSTVVKMIENIGMIKNILNQHPIKNVKTKLLFGDGNHTFDLEDLLRATADVLMSNKCWSLYKARLENGIIICVKKLKDVIVTREEFEQQMEVMGRIRHANVAELRAYYYSENVKLLIYEYYDQDSVSTILHGDRGSAGVHVDWKTRLKIAVGAARGIAHIHRNNDEKLVHGNIRASNIFLNEHQYGLVSDMGLAKMSSQITYSFMQSAGYCAPEVTNSMEVSHASDVYSFGVLLLELVSGKSPQGISIVKWILSVSSEEWAAEVFDVELRMYEKGEAIMKLLQIGMDCIAIVPESRPKMADIVKMLEEISGSETDGHPTVESTLKDLLTHVDTMKW